MQTLGSISEKLSHKSDGKADSYFGTYCCAHYLQKVDAIELEIIIFQHEDQQGYEAVICWSDAWCASVFAAGFTSC